MKTLKMPLLGGLPLLLFLSCEKEAIPTPALVSDTTEEIILRTNSGFDDPELEGNDAIDDIATPQTDFLFDTSQGKVTLMGTEKLYLVDEILTGSAFDLVSFSHTLNLFEPNNLTRKVGSANLIIKELQSLQPGIAKGIVDIRFDFGHGSVYCEASIEFKSVNAAANEFSLNDIQLVKGTGLLSDIKGQMEMDFIEGTMEEVDENTLQVSCNFDLLFEQQ